MTMNDYMLFIYVRCWKYVLPKSWVCLLEFLLLEVYLQFVYKMFNRKLNLWEPTEPKHNNQYKYCFFICEWCFGSQKEYVFMHNSYGFNKFKIKGERNNLM